MDVIISLKRPKGHDPAAGVRFDVKFEKARHLFGADIASFEAWFELNDHNRYVWVRLDSVSMDQKVASAKMLSEKGRSCAQIGQQLSVDKSTVSRWLKRPAAA